MLIGSAGYRALTDTVGAVEVRRDVIVATGPDTVTFLQSQLSQDVVAMLVGETRWSFHLTPQGKPIAFLRLTRFTAAPDVEGVRIDLDAGFGGRVLEALNRFKIRTKCTLELLEQVPYIAVRGPASAACRDLAGAVPAAWNGWAGVDVDAILYPDGIDGVEVVDPDVYEAARIFHGVPRNGAEIDDSVIPAETGVVPIAVNFTKGCYVGQELVERIDSRGHVNRHLRGLDFVGAAIPPIGAELHSTDGKGVGRITSAAIHPLSGRVVALGYVRRELGAGDPVVTRWEDEGVVTEDSATVRALAPSA